jgi:hypothetical protein
VQALFAKNLDFFIKRTHLIQFE